jgi:NADPH2:quinone reductase
MRYSVWIVTTSGGPFQRIERELKPLSENEVLVKISASGVNPLDVKIRMAQAGHAQQPLPAVLGLDMAGTVEEVGPRVTRFKPGDEVFGMVGGVGGLQGTLAEFIVADADLLARKPASLTMRQAAALPLVSITSWEALVDRAHVGLGDTVLVHAGAGGLGYTAIQLAKSRGARVFATVSAEKRSAIENLGVTSIDYRNVPVERYVADLTGGKGFDIIFDTLGDSTLDDSFKAIKHYTGRVVSAMGWGTHQLAPLSFRGASYSGVFTLLPMLTGEGRPHHAEILERVAGLADSGKLLPLLYPERLSFAEIDRAYAEVQRSALGKVVLEV